VNADGVESATGPDERGVDPAAAVAEARVRVPTRGNRRLEALLEGVNADLELRTWWHMAQVVSERLGMSDHSWVHVQIVLNIALRLLRLLGR
jgi:metal-dependent HD superfamily phosphatase/phosphodiesterase